MAVHGGKVYVMGGFDGVQRLASVEAYDPFHNRWTQVNMNAILMCYLCVTLHQMFLKAAIINIFQITIISCM